MVDRYDFRRRDLFDRISSMVFSVITSGGRIAAIRLQ